MKTEISIRHQKEYSRRQWAAMMNCLSGFKSANLIGTISKGGQTNLCVVSSVIHIGSAPPLIGFILRPHSDKSPRHTFMNIMETDYFSINHITSDLHKRAHQTSARYPKEVSEFEACNIKPEFIEGFVPPVVVDSPVQIILQKKEVSDIKLNETKLIIGEVKSFFIDSQFIKDDGYIDIESLGTVCISGLDGYHRTQRLNRLSYAKPDKPLSEI